MQRARAHRLSLRCLQLSSPNANGWTTTHAWHACRRPDTHRSRCCWLAHQLGTAIRPTASEERTKPLPWQPRQDRRHGRTDRTVPLVIGELDSNARSSSRSPATAAGRAAQHSHLRLRRGLSPPPVVLHVPICAWETVPGFTWPRF